MITLGVWRRDVERRWLTRGLEGIHDGEGERMRGKDEDRFYFNNYNKNILKC